MGFFSSMILARRREQFVNNLRPAGTADVPPKTDNNAMEKPLSYKPSAYYFRTALRGATSTEEAVRIGLQLVSELELQKQWIRDHGLIPPKWNVMRSESDGKGWDIEPVERAD
jgi:hypothetical protein